MRLVALSPNYIKSLDNGLVEVTLKDIVFIHKDNIKPYVTKYEERLVKEKKDREIKNSIYNRRLRLAIATKDMSFEDNDVDESALKELFGNVLKA